MKIAEKLKALMAAVAIVGLGVGGVAVMPSGDAYAETYKCVNNSDSTDVKDPDTNVSTNNGCSAGYTYTDVDATTTTTGTQKYSCPNGQEGTGKDYTTACNGKGVSVSAGASTDLMSTLNTIINVVIGIVGFIAVVMIIVGGIQYTTSAGDAGKTTKAKNTIMYGVVGLVIALLAFAIVNFILSNIFHPAG